MNRQDRIEGIVGRACLYILLHCILLVLLAIYCQGQETSFIESPDDLIRLALYSWWLIPAIGFIYSAYLIERR